MLINVTACLLFFVMSTSLITITIAGKSKKSEDQETEPKGTDPYVIMERYEPCEVGKTIMRFENLRVDHNGADKSITAQFDLYMDKLMDSPTQFDVYLGTAKKKGATNYFPFFSNKIDDICPKFEKEGTLKDVMEILGFVNQTCPIKAGYYDRKHNRGFVIPPTAQKILVSNDFWEVKARLKNVKTKETYLCLDIYFQTIKPGAKAKSWGGFGK